jgi:hypothetical protein
LETGGGDTFDDFLENAGMVPPRQLPLPLVEPEPEAKEEHHTAESNWFKKFVGK